MSPTAQSQELVAAFPISDTKIALIYTQPVPRSFANADLYNLESGLAVHNVELDEEWPGRLILDVDSMPTMPITVDAVRVRGLGSAAGEMRQEIVSPPFIQGIPSAMELKVPHFADRFPYSSTLVGLHVSVLCCTGCNGGVHDRNLVVLNHHLGGGWSGIWIRTGKTIEGPYPRWQRVLCAGGVIAEVGGSTTIIDKGWMVIQKQDEPAHHAPPPLPIETVDIPKEHTTSLLSKSLDGAWVEFTGVAIDSARWVDAKESEQGFVNLPRTEVVFHDKSGAQSVAWLYQTSARKVQSGQRLHRLRGFIHAEAPGVYVLISDKEEDMFL